MKKAALLLIAFAAPADAGQHVFSGPDTIARYRSRTVCEQALRERYRRHAARLAAEPTDDVVETELSPLLGGGHSDLYYYESSRLRATASGFDQSWRHSYRCAGRRLKHSFDGSASIRPMMPPMPPPPPPPDSETD